MSSTLIENIKFAYNVTTTTSPKLRAYRRQLWTSRLRVIAIALAALINAILVARGIWSLFQ